MSPQAALRGEVETVERRDAADDLTSSDILHESMPISRVAGHGRLIQVGDSARPPRQISTSISGSPTSPTSVDRETPRWCHPIRRLDRLSDRSSQYEHRREQLTWTGGFSNW
jgi:hypothetical protein